MQYVPWTASNGPYIQNYSLLDLMNLNGIKGNKSTTGELSY